MFPKLFFIVVFVVIADILVSIAGSKCKVFGTRI